MKMPVGTVGVAMPAADATGTLNLSGTAGKVALMNTNVLIADDRLRNRPDHGGSDGDDRGDPQERRLP
ncbi:MAG: hypothetical protein H7335_12215 [Massilia sp.]|nr:hypothetical protein [Massilia sp.]